MYKLVIYVPSKHTQLVKEAIFKAGGGRLGNYDSCCWQVSGTGQFRPLKGSHAFVGQKGRVEEVNESRLEFVCEDHLIRAVIDAMIIAHPYEEPAYDVWPLANLDSLP